MTAPTLAVGDGALGFWAALAQVFPATRVQHCWVHKTANMLAALPQRLHGDAKAALAKIYSAETRADALDAAEQFAADFASPPRRSQRSSTTSTCC